MSDIHYEPFDPQRLLTALSRVRDAAGPDFQIGRSGNQTGNIAIYDTDGEYIGCIDLDEQTTTILWSATADEWSSWDEETAQWTPNL